MRPAHSPASRLAVFTTLATAALLVELTADAGSRSMLVVIVCVLLLLVAGAAKLWFHNCFESRALIVLGLAATEVGALLSLTVGLPTSDRQPLNLAMLGLLVLPVVVVALLTLDARRRRPPVEPPRSPYAL
ncbi:hypothetical protein NODU109028_20870 [Nocardioides dubius]|uniref:Uncharacterized protein n=1 Tax=Nocardioides dubius TaxID=317019 RepID=A0ABP4EMM5_9ACTN